MSPATDPRRRLRCAIYTRVSTDHGLDQEFNSLDAQREACEADIASQKPRPRQAGKANLGRSTHRGSVGS